jgi:hypothetical protein
MKAILAGAMLALMTASAAAFDVPDADFILPYCKLTNVELNSLDRFAAMLKAHCDGIISGVRFAAEALRTAQSLGRVRLDPTFCAAVPIDVPLDRVVDVVVRYAEGHSTEVHGHLDSIALLAMHQAWPCQPLPYPNPSASKNFAGPKETTSPRPAPRPERPKDGELWIGPTTTPLWSTTR